MYVLAKMMFIFNYTTEKNQLMNGFVSWRGAHEKRLILMQMFIEDLCKLITVVMEVTTLLVGLQS